MNKKIYFLLTVIIGLYSCVEPPEQAQPTPYNMEIPDFFPRKLNIPYDNQITEEGVKLGRYLFYDGRLSGRTEKDSMFSCYSCHKQENAFDAGYNVSGKAQGITGALTPRSVLPLINLVFINEGYTWDAAKTKSIEDIVYATLIDSVEMAGNIDTIVKKISQIPLYPPMFKAAFGTEKITADLICKAIAQFTRTLVSANSRFDKFVSGRGSLTDDEHRGYDLFATEEGADCFHCHGGKGNMRFSTYLTANNGLDADGIPYRIPTLRNIGFTAPYMHDGRFQTLDEVIDHYSEHIVFSPTISPLMHHLREGGVQLTPNEKQSLKAFLHSLNDTTFVTNKEHSNPFE